MPGVLALRRGEAAASCSSSKREGVSSSRSASASAAASSGSPAMRHQVGTSTAMQAACPVSCPISRSMSRPSTLLSVYPPAPLATGQDAGVLPGDDRVVRAVAEYGGVDFERLHGLSFRFQGDRGPETGPLSDVSSMAYTLKAPRLTCRPCASRPRRAHRARMPPPSIGRPRRYRRGRRARRRWARRSPHCARRSPRR